MALGTVTALEHLETFGDRKAAIVTIQCTSGANYTTGGESVAAALSAVTTISTLQLLLIDPTPAGTRLVTYAHTTDKLKVFTAVGTEAASNSDQSTFLVHALAIGY